MGVHTRTAAVLTKKSAILFTYLIVYLMIYRLFQTF